MKQTLRSTWIAFLLLLLPVVTFAAPSRVSYSGGDGSSFAKAIVIHGATEQTGVDAEYHYLTKHYPGYRRGRQSLTTHRGRNFDVLEFTNASGNKITIYFDITEFFGKF